MKLIIAQPSPFARKARIAMLEKGLRHEVVVDNPWIAAAVREVNPLGKVPALILADGRAIYDSRVIVGYLETLEALPALIPVDARLRVVHRQIESLADGICDAVVLITLERARHEAQRSTDWIARQAAKIPPAVAELERMLGGRDFYTTHGYGLAEIATGCALGYLDLRYPEFDWRRRAPALAGLFEILEQRPSFALTRPGSQEIPAG